MATSSERLEREADETRARLQSTLEELRYRVTPGQLIDEVLDFTSEGQAGAFVGSLKDQILRRPLAVLLIGAGLAWLMLPDRAPRAAVPPGDGADPGAGATGVPDDVGGRTTGPFEKVRKTTREALSATRQRGEDLRNRGAHLAGAMPNALSSDEPGEATIASGGDAGRASSGVLDPLWRFCREQPLLVASAGLAVGALVGAVAAKAMTGMRSPGRPGRTAKSEPINATGRPGKPPVVPATAIGEGVLEIREGVGIVPDHPNGDDPPAGSSGPGAGETPRGHR